MEQTKRPASKVKMALMWLIFVGLSVGWIAFLLSRHRDTPVSTEPGPDLIRAIITLIIGGFFFVAGVGSYFILLATDCFTFNFQRPVWGGVKGKLYVANIVVMTGMALGLGFGLTPFDCAMACPMRAAL